MHSAFYRELDRDTFHDEMVEHRRLVVRLHVTRVYGVIGTSGRRPVSSDT